MSNKVDNFMATLLLVIVGAALLWAGLTASSPKTSQAPKHEYYALATVVVELAPKDDLVIVEDSNGNLWAFYGVEDWQVGDNANLLMDTQDTESVYDDAVVGATYAQWTLTH